MARQRTENAADNTSEENPQQQEGNAEAKPEQSAGEQSKTEQGKSEQSKSEPKSEQGKSEQSRASQASAQQAGQGSRTGQSTGRAIASLKADHRAVEQLFDRYAKGKDAERRQLRRDICQSLLLHTRLEEDIFYPACRSARDAEDLLEEAQVEHDSATVLIAAILAADETGQRDDQWLDARIKVLADQVRHHIGEEEQAGSGVFAKAQAAGIDTPDLAQRLAERREDLEAEQQLEPGRPVSLEAAAFTRSSKQKENTMARSQEMNRDRDDRGRFVSDDDRGQGSRGGGGNYGGGDRYRDDDGRFASRGGGGGNGRGSSRDDDRDDGRGDGRGWYGDSRGHSQAAQRGWDERGGSRGRDDDDDDRRSRSSRGRYEDDDDDRGGRGGSGRGSGGGRGQGGWFGDPEGHSEASRRGWDNPDHGPSGWYGDSRGHSEASRRGWDNPDHGPSGWYGDSRGHSEASRRGWDNPDHGRSGWFGDPEGHSEASRRGWDDRGGSRSSSSRNDDDDRGGRGGSRGGGNGGGGNGGGGRGGRGHGGWSGDPEGHAEAARRGWENRR